MTILEILTYPNKFLSNPVKQIKNIQVGHDKSLLVYDVSPKDEERSLQVLINPRIISKEGTVISEEEGCLSVPEFRSDVKRASLILVEGVDREGKPLRIEAEGLLALVLQHEIDHLNGKLFIDRISSLKRQIYKRRVKKNLKDI
jgi:peptide deformylase